MWESYQMVNGRRVKWQRQAMRRDEERVERRVCTAYNREFEIKGMWKA